MKIKNIITNNIKTTLFSGLFALSFIPMFAHAKGKKISDLLEDAQGFLSTTVLNLLITVAMISFFWGLISYFLFPDNAAKREEGAKYIMYGLVALTLIFALWGVITVLANTFGIQFGGVLAVPQLGN